MIASKVISKFNVRRVAASIDESSLGRGWHDYFAAGDFNELHGVQRGRLDNLSSQLGGGFSAEDLAIINKYYDFQLPHDAFTGIGIREWNSGNLIDSGDQRIISEFELKIDEYNLAHSTIVDRFSGKQTGAITQIAGDVSKELIDEGIPDHLWDNIYDKIGIPKDARNVAIN